MRFDLRDHPRPAVMLWSVAGDRDPLRRDEDLDAYAGCHLQASGADVQDARLGVPRHNGAGESEGDRVVGHLVALAKILARRRQPCKRAVSLRDPKDASEGGRYVGRGIPRGTMPWGAW